MARRLPPFRFASKAAAHSGGKLKPRCKRVSTPTGTRYLCATGASSAPKRSKKRARR